MGQGQIRREWTCNLFLLPYIAGSCIGSLSPIPTLASKFSHRAKICHAVASARRRATHTTFPRRTPRNSRRATSANIPIAKVCRAEAPHRGTKAGCAELQTSPESLRQASLAVAWLPLPPSSCAAVLIYSDCGVHWLLRSHRGVCCIKIFPESVSQGPASPTALLCSEERAISNAAA